MHLIFLLSHFNKSDLSSLSLLLQGLGNGNEWKHMRVVTVQRKRQLSCFFWRRGLFFLQSSLTNSGVHGRFTLGRMPPISCCYSIIACKWLNQQPQAVIRTAVFSCFQCFSVQLKTRAGVNYSWPHLQISPQSSPTALTWTLQLHLWRLTPSPHC